MLKSDHSEIVQICTQAIVEFLENLPRMISQSNNTENKKVLFFVNYHSVVIGIVVFCSSIRTSSFHCQRMEKWYSIKSYSFISSHSFCNSSCTNFGSKARSWISSGLYWDCNLPPLRYKLWSIFSFSKNHTQIQRLALSLLDYINSNFHSVFVPRVAPAILQAIISQGNIEGIRCDSFCELYSLISSPYTSTSIHECKDITDFIITAIYRNVMMLMLVWWIEWGWSFWDYIFHKILKCM